MDNFNVLEQLRELLGQFLSFIPNFVGAVVILLVGWIVARIVRKVFRKLLVRIGIDKLAERLNQIDVVSKAKFNISFSAILASVLYYLLMLVFLIMSTETLGMQVVSNLISDLFDFIPLLLSAAIIFVLGIILSDLVRKVVLTTCQSLGIPSGKAISAFVFYFILINVAISALSQASVNTEFLASNISIVLGGAVLAFGIGYGLASKDIFADFITSFYHKNKFKIGQVITYKDKTGQITQISKTSLVMRVENGNMIIPLHKMSKEEILIHDQ